MKFRWRRISIIGQCLLELGCVAGMIFLTVTLFSDLTSYRAQINRQKQFNYSEMLDLSFYRLLNSVNSSVDLGAYTKYPLAYFHLEDPKTHLVAIHNTKLSSRERTFVEERLNDDLNSYPQVVCRNSCYVLNFYRSKSSSKVAWYALPLKFLLDNVASEFPVENLAVVSIANFTHRLESDEILKQEYSRQVKLNLATEPRQTSLQNIRKHYGQISSVKDALDFLYHPGSQVQYLTLDLQFLHLPVNSSLYLIYSPRNLSWNHFWAEELNHLVVLFLIALLYLLIFFRKNLAFRSLLDMIRRKQTQGGDHLIQDELSLAQMKLKEIIKTNLSQQQRIRHLNNLLQRYSNFDLATELPLKEQFCRDVATRILTFNPMEYSALALLNINYSLVAHSESQLQTVLVEVRMILSRLLRDKDCLGLDENQHFAVFFYNRRSRQLIEDLLQQMMDAVISKYEQRLQKGSHLMGCGFSCLTSVDTTSKDLYFQAEMAMNVAIQNYQSSPLIYSADQSSSINLSDVEFSHRFEQDLEKKKIYGVYYPVIDRESGGTCAMVCAPSWHYQNDQVLQDDEVYSLLKQKRNFQQLGYMLMEDGLRTLRKIDQINPDLVDFACFYFSIEQLEDPKLLEFLALMIEKYTLLPDRVVMILNYEQVVKEAARVGQILQSIKEQGYQLAIRYINALDQMNETVRRFGFDMVIINSNLIVELQDDQVQLDLLINNLRSLEATGHRSWVYQIGNANLSALIQNQIMPSYLSGTGVETVTDLSDIVHWWGK